MFLYSIVRVFVLNKAIVPGSSFNLSIRCSVRFSKLFGNVYHTEISDGQILLDSDQYVQPFSVVKKACTTVDFTVFSTIVVFLRMEHYSFLCCNNSR